MKGIEKKCDKMGCIVTPSICSSCKHECDSSLRKPKKEKHGRSQKRSKAVHKRARAIRVLERNLKASCFVKEPGDALFKGWEQPQDVFCSNVIGLVADDAKKLSKPEKKSRKRRGLGSVKKSSTESGTKIPRALEKNTEHWRGKFR